MQPLNNLTLLSRRCSGCLMHHHDCLCPHLSKVSSHLDLDVFIHYRDVRKPSNSGRLAGLCLDSARIHIHGEKGHPTQPPAFSEGSVLLFPCPGAQELDVLVEKSPVPLTHLVVVDGNWAQALRMTKRISGLKGIPAAILPPGSPSRYRLRREPINRPEGLATAEAIARALTIMGDPKAGQHLLSLFNLMVSRTLRSRGRRDLLDESDQWLEKTFMDQRREK